MTEAFRSVASMWIGSTLSYLERVVIQSFLDRGHNFTLYTLHPVANVPDGVVLRDARTILVPPFEMDCDRVRFTAGIYSDLFRLEMIAMTDAIWVDLDAYCVAPFDFEGPYVFGSTRKRRASPNNGVLGLPTDSAALSMLRIFLNDPNPIPWWWNARRTGALLEKRAAGVRYGIENFAWSFSGPLALRKALEKTGEITHILSKDVLYPVGFNQSDLLLSPDTPVEMIETPRTRSVHLFGATKLTLIGQHGGRPPAGCYIDRICRRHGVDIDRFPLDMSRGGRELVSDNAFDSTLIASSAQVAGEP